MFHHTPVSPQLFWGVLNGLFRTHAVCNVVKVRPCVHP